MAHNWDSSKRPPHPPQWPQLRSQVIARAHGLCEHDDCNYPGKDVDHIINLANGGTHALNNLQLLCTWHHKQKTAREAAEARKPRPREARQKPQHPGYV